MAKSDYSVPGANPGSSPISTLVRGAAVAMSEDDAKAVCEGIRDAADDNSAKALAKFALKNEISALAIVAILRGAGFASVIPSADERLGLAVNVLCGKVQIKPVLGWFASWHYDIAEVLPNKDAAQSYVDQLNEAGEATYVVQRALWVVGNKTALADVKDFPVISRHLAIS